MAEACKQEGKIGGLQAAVEAIEKSLDKLSAGQERFITILEKIAEQGTKVTKLENDVDEMFGRLRTVEIRAAEERVKIGGIVAGVAAFSSALTAAIVKKFWE